VLVVGLGVNMLLILGGLQIACHKLD
jgi:hypothetical protein